MRPWTVVLILLLAASLVQAGGDSSGVRQLASLSISTGTDTAWVFIDSLRLGLTPFTSDSLRPGAHQLRLVQTDVSSWLTGSIADSILLSPGEERSLRYTFEHRVAILTDPSGAIVFIGDSLAGTTPLVLLRTGDERDGTIRLEKRGYESTPLPPSAIQGGISRTNLRRIWQSELPDGPLLTGGNGSRNSFRLYVAGGATLVSGVAAAYFKIKADGRNALYMETGDPSFRSETRRLDTAAAVSLTITQIGFAFLAYFLLSD